MPIPPRLSYSLSDGDLAELAPGVPVIRYRDLTDVGRLLAESPAEAAFVLFETAPSRGHWCLLLGSPGGADVLEWMDPYGDGYPDDQRRVLTRAERAALGELAPKAGLAMLDSGYRRLARNTTAFQELAPGVNTCGRHCLMRLAFRDLGLKAYERKIRRLSRRLGLTADELSVLFTSGP